MDDKQNIIIYRTSDGRASVALYAKDGKIWLNQQQMAELFATSKQLISHHIANILKDKELDGFSVVKQYLTTAADGKNDVTKDEVNLSVVSNFSGFTSKISVNTQNSQIHKFTKSHKKACVSHDKQALTLNSLTVNL